MALTKFKLGDLIELIDERNSDGIRNFYGVNINKEFMPTVADTSTLNEKKYKVVRKNRFVFSGMQTGRDECIRLAFHQKDEPIIVSPAYFTFEVTATDKILPEYFFMIFQSKEKDRLGWFLSDSSVRANLEWKTFCGMEIQFPPIEIQKKFVAVYNSMLANQKSYERGLDDLKLVCDGYMDKIKHTAKKIPLGNLIGEVDERNIYDQYEFAYGINLTKNFMPSIVSSEDLRRYKIVRKNNFVCSLMRVGRDKIVPVALNYENESKIVSPAYFVFKVTSPQIISDYLFMWLSRSESDRRAWFMSDTSIRSGVEKNRFLEIEIPIPDIKIQKSISEIHNIYQVRKKLAEELKLQLRNICPILIKGALNEGERS